MLLFLDLFILLFCILKGKGFGRGGAAAFKCYHLFIYFQEILRYQKISAFCSLFISNSKKLIHFQKPFNVIHATHIKNISSFHMKNEQYKNHFYLNCWQFSERKKKKSVYICVWGITSL